MGKYRRVRPLQGIFELGQGIIPVEQPPAGNAYPGIQGVQGAHHRVVLKARRNHRCPGLYQRPDGQIQSVGAGGGQHHLLRLAGKELSSRLPAVVHRFRRFHGPIVAAPARIGAGAHGSFHRPVDGGWLVKGGGSIIQIDHTSTIFPSPLWTYTRRMGI